jgi:hypothetical protein
VSEPGGGVGWGVLRLGYAGGPAREFREVLGSNEFLLGAFISDAHITPLFPSCDADAARSPLVKGPYDAALHLAIGNLKQADATKNGVPGTLPFTDFFAPDGEIIQGANLLDVHGPMFFAIVREVLPKLLPELGEAFCAAKNADDINDVMLRHVQWCAARCVFQKVASVLSVSHLHSHTSWNTDCVCSAGIPVVSISNGALHVVFNLLLHA